MVSTKSFPYALLFAASVAALFAMQGPEAYAAPACESPLSDPDGDGWGWENQGSCAVVADEQASPEPDQPDAAQITAPSTPSHPACSDPASDSDGDGFGWEQNRTCIAVSSASATPGVTEPDTPSEPVNPAVPAPSRFPACKSDASDPDGDGFGWESGSTCIVTIGSTPVVIESTAVPSQSGPPVCELANSDPDGDGFGWENLSTCIVAEADDRSNTTVSPTPAPEGPSGLIRFMAVGDSITHGGVYDDVETLSYRSAFTELMNNADCNYMMTGSQTANHRHDGLVSLHESYAGHRADDFLNGRNNGAGNNEGIAIALQRFNPDAVLLFLGTNDILQGQDISQTTAELDQIIAFILDANARVFVANVTPVFRTTAQTRIDQYGDQIEAYVAQLANPMVTLVDVRSDFTRTLMLDDNLHPNEEGDAFVANAFFSSVLDAGYCTG